MTEEKRHLAEHGVDRKAGDEQQQWIEDRRHDGGNLDGGGRGVNA